MRGLFSLISSLIGFYSFLCLIRIVLTWIPQIQHNYFVNLLASICDPFLSLFRFDFAQIGFFDFSPFLALFVLYFMQGFFQAASKRQVFNAFSFLAIFVSMIFSIVGGILNFALLILVIRLIMELTEYSYNSRYCVVVDSTFAPLYRIASRFSGNGSTTNTIIASIGVLAVAKILVSIIAFM